MSGAAAREQTYFEAYRDLANQISQGLARIETVTRVLSGKGFDKDGIAETQGEMAVLSEQVAQMRVELDELKRGPATSQLVGTK